MPLRQAIGKINVSSLAASLLLATCQNTTFSLLSRYHELTGLVYLIVFRTNRSEPTIANVNERELYSHVLSYTTWL